MVSVEIIDPLTDARWAEVAEAANATLYHSAAWARLLAATYGFRPRYYLGLDGQKVVGGLPFFEVGGGWRSRRLVSLPFSDVGGLAGDSSVATTLLTAAMNDGLRERWRTVEIRGPVEQQDRQGFNEVKRNDLYTLRLDRSLGDMTKGFSDSVRWGRKRALRDGLRAERRWSDGALRDFYRLHQITRRKLGVPVQPWRFFRSLWSEFSPGNEAFIMQARGAGQVTASAVFLRHRQRLYYKFAASDPLALASQPNSLILWEAIEWAHAAGLSEVDFGKTAHENAGLARFKRSWGAVPTAVSYYYFPRVTGLGAKSEHSTRLRAARAVWRRLPLPAARLLGGFLYRGLA